MDTNSQLSRRSFSMLVATTLLGACSSNDGAATTPGSASARTEPPTSNTPQPPESSVVVETSVSDGTTTTVGIPVPTMPLTGLPVPSDAVARRPALVVKIDNHPQARPQSGLNSADIVFEENVENLTRFAAVFHGANADPVGPIRSGRTQDVALLGSLNAPLFAWSGGNRRVTDAILNSDLRQFSEGSPGFFRSTNRKKPHNLYTTATAMYALAPFGAGPPSAQFSFRSVGDSIAGDDVAGVKISMDGVRVLWTWDSEMASFVRQTDDNVHIDELDRQQLSTQNIVILTVAYAPSPADVNSPEAQTIGTGEAVVLSGGKLVRGQWNRADRSVPFALTDSAGNTILLSPGRTYVELARAGKAATVPVSVDPSSVPYP